MTFPLKLVPFEEYMVADNSPEYPRAFVVEVQLLGKLERAALETAWHASVRRHPLLRSLLVRGRRGWQWMEIEEVPLPYDWAGPDAPIVFVESELIDLTREPGVRLWVRSGDSEARLVLQFHHACCDGVGSLQFIGDLLAAYAREVSGPDAVPESAALQPELLANRGTFGLGPPTAWTLLRDVTIGVLESCRLVGRRPLAIDEPAPDASQAKSPIRYPGIESYTFTAAELQDLRRTAKAADATLNDLLMCHLFQAIVQWNAAQAKQPRHGWLRINVPTNLRRKEDEPMPAANVMSFTFIDRHTRKCRDTGTLLESIRAEMETIKRLRLGLYFIGQLAVLASIPKGLSLMLSGKRCFATAVLTNVGDPSRRFNVRFPRHENQLVIGNLLLKNVIGCPPLRDLTRAGVAITTYAGQLSVSVQCDRHCFSQEDARRLLDTYIGHVRSGLSEGGSQAGALQERNEPAAP